MMTPEAIEAYVRSALVLQGYRLDEAQIAEVTLQFARIESIARSVSDLPLPAELEQAPVFKP